MRKLTGILLLLFFVFIANPTREAEAHGFGLPPFLRINGKLADINNYYQGYDSFTTLTIPQDLAPEAYLPDTEVTATVDDKVFAMQVDENDVQRAFRWSVKKGENYTEPVYDYSYGTRVSYTFPQPGSYLVVIEIKDPLTDTYNPLDMFQVDIVPSADYKRPDALVVTSAKTLPLNTENRYSLKPILDPKGKNNARYFWDFSDKNLRRGQSVSYRFKDDFGYLPVYLRIIDGNGLAKDIGFSFFRRLGKAEVAPFDNMKQAPVAVDGSVGTPAISSRTLFIILPTVVIIVIMVIILRKPKEKKQQ